MEVTTKILDNTVISASIGDIKAIDLLELCASKYNLVTSKEVYDETMRYPDREVVRNTYKRITVKNNTTNRRYQTLIKYLKTRYPYLHSGELSSFLLALLEYEFNSKKYYYITDDGKMRNTISKIKKNAIFSQQLGRKIVNFTYSGTVGLIKRLCEGGLLNRDQLKHTIADLDRGAFYMRHDLREYLRELL